MKNNSNNHNFKLEKSKEDKNWNKGVIVFLAIVFVAAGSAFVLLRNSNDKEVGAEQSEQIEQLENNQIENQLEKNLENASQSEGNSSGSGAGASSSQKALVEKIKVPTKKVIVPTRNTWEQAELAKNIQKIEEWTGADNLAQFALVLAFPPTQDRYFNGLLLNALGQLGRKTENESQALEAQDKLYGFIILAQETLNDQTQAEALQAMQSLTSLGRPVEQYEFESLLTKQTMLLGKNMVSMLVSLQDYRAKQMLQQFRAAVETNSLPKSLMEDSLEKQDTLEEIRNLEILVR
jgi:hypothetical protein